MGRARNRLTIPRRRMGNRRFGGVIHHEPRLSSNLLSSLFSFFSLRKVMSRVMS